MLTYSDDATQSPGYETSLFSSKEICADIDKVPNMSKLKESMSYKFNLLYLRYSSDHWEGH